MQTQREKLEGRICTLLTQMASWLLLAESGDKYGLKRLLGRSATPLGPRTVFLTARSLLGLCAAWPHVLTQHLIDKNRKSLPLKSYEESLADLAAWLMKLGVSDQTQDVLCWWSTDSTPLEITRSTCAVIAALMEYRDHLNNLLSCRFSDDKHIRAAEESLREVERSITSGVKWVVQSITQADQLVFNEHTSDQAILTRGTLPSLPIDLYKTLCNAQFDAPSPTALTFEEACEELQRFGYTPQAILAIGSKSLGESFPSMVSEGERGAIRFRSDPWATSDALWILTRQLEYQRAHGTSPATAQSTDVLGAILLLLSGLEASLLPCGVWDSEHACANLFIASAIAHAQRVVGPGPGFRNGHATVITTIQRLLNQSSIEEIDWQTLDGLELGDPCMLIGLLRYMYVWDRERRPLESFEPVYNILHDFTGRYPSHDSAAFRYIPYAKPQIDKTAWGIFCMSRILGRHGCSQRQLQARKRWSLYWYSSGFTKAPQLLEASLKAQFIPSEIEYPLFEFTHGLNAPHIKRAISNSGVCSWIDLGCGNGRNLGLLRELSESQLAQLCTAKGLDARDDSLRKEFELRHRQWFPNADYECFIHMPLSQLDETEKYDVATATLLLHEIPLGSLLLGITNALRSLRSDGQLIVVDLCDIWSQETQVVTWECEELVGLFRTFSKRVYREAEGRVAVNCAHTVREIPYFAIRVSRPSKVSDVTAEQEVAFRNVAETKLAKYETRWQEIISEVNRIVNGLIKNEDLAKLYQQRQFHMSIKKVLEDDTIISELSVEDVERCYEAHQLAQQVKTLKAFIQQS